MTDKPKLSNAEWIKGWRTDIDNKRFWAYSSGDHLNALEHALDLLEAAEARADFATFAFRAEQKKADSLAHWGDAAERVMSPLRADNDFPMMCSGNAWHGMLANSAELRTKLEAAEARIAKLEAFLDITDQGREYKRMEARVKELETEHGPLKCAKMLPPKTRPDFYVDPEDK